MGLGTYVPDVAVEAQGGTTVVTVNVNDASDLSGAAVNLRYDATRYTPDRVEFGDFLGSKDEVITLAITNSAEVVPVGAVQLANTGVQPVNGSGTLAKVYFRNEPFSAGRVVSGFGEAAAVDNLRLEGVTAIGATLVWDERNPGDYNQDGSVLVSDLAPIGIYFGQSVQLAENADYLEIVDGSGDKIINVQDLTTIGVNYANKLSGYAVFVDNAGEVKYNGEAISVMRADQGFTPDGSGRMTYNFFVELEGLPSLDFSVAPMNDSEPDAPNPPRSNVVSIFLEPGPPAAVTDLLAEGGAAFPDRTVRLTWSKSTSLDVSSYSIWRKLTSAPEDAWALVVPSVVSNLPTITHDHFIDGAEEVSYDFRVQVNDIAGESSNSNTASATPRVDPVIINAPANVTVSPGGAQLSIDISWPVPNQPAGVTVTGYKLFRKAPGESVFSLLDTKNNKFTVSHSDLALTEGETYEYNVVTLATVQGKTGTFESPASPNGSGQPSAAVSFEIISITNSKTTHHTSGSEDAANIEIVFSVVPDGVNWSNSVGGGALPTGSGTSWTWKPSAGSAKGIQTLTVTANKGAQNDNATLDMIVTSIDLNTSDAGVVGFKAPDFSGSFLQQANEGGEIFNSTLYAETNGKVYLAKAWESW
jgi:hypothetical protein